MKASSGGYTSVLSGAAKIEKMKEAEEYRTKAKKAMSRGMFSQPDPIAASMFYKRAADAYKLCGENRLERLHRIASGDCQMGQDAYATAAAEYTRAAELSATSDEPDARKRQECHKLHSDAANAWRQMGENGRAGQSMMNAAFSMLIGFEPEEGVQMAEKPKLMNMDKKALAAIEVAVETHTPDPLNRYRSFRQTGRSAYEVQDKKGADPNTTEAQMMALAKENLIRTAYAHETVFKAVFKLIQHGEYPSALYAAGAASAILEADDFATISLSRAFCTETIITLALGDVVSADKYFMEVHLQRTSYLSSRECKLAEDLTRAVKMMDGDALEEARSPTGANRAALANLDPGLRSLVNRIQTSGRARRDGGGGGGGARPRAAGGPPGRAPAGGRGGPPPGRGGASGRGAPPAATRGPAPGTGASAPPPPAAKKDDELHGEELQSALDANFAELDDLMGDMGLDSDDEGGLGRLDDEDAKEEVVAEEEEDDDDFIDLR